MDEQQFVQLLESLLQPDTERVKNATATLNKNYYSSPASLNALLQILCGHPKTDLRQLAAVEARKLVTKHWASLPADQKAALRNQLFQATLNDEVTLTRHSAARVIAQIAAQDFEDGEWADLPGYLHQAATSPTARHREVGTYIIWTTLESTGDAFPGKSADLYKLFSTTIQDSESAEVRINTMLGLSRMAMLMDAEEDPKGLAMFQEAIPAMVVVLKGTVDEGDEERAMQAFEVFQTLLSCDSALLQKHFGDLVRFMLELASSTTVEDDYRSQALAFLMHCVRYRKLKIQSLRIGEELTLKALHIVTELGDLSSDDEDVTPARSALGLLDVLASSLPPSQVVIPLLKNLGNYFTSQNPDYRQAGILALGMCVEGAPDFIATQLHEILPMVLHLLEDPELKVRAAALNGVARLADDLAEDVGKEHARLIPAMIVNFDLAANNAQNAEDEHNLSIIRGSCMAIDSLIEGLDPEDAGKYVPELIPRFSKLFDHEDLRVKEVAISAVGSIACAAEQAFLPFFEQTMHALSPYVRVKDSQDELDLRGVTCDTMGKIASAVGAQPFEPYVLPLMEASEEALHLDHPRLRETSYILWSTMAKVYEEQFAKYLPGTVKGLQECLEQEETGELIGEEALEQLNGSEVVIGGTKFQVAPDDDDDDSDLNEAAMGDEDEDDWDDLEGVSAVAMEKEIAAEVFGDIITHTRREYIPYLEATVTKLLELVNHSYEGIRKAAIGTLWRTFACLFSLAEGDGMAKWQPGLPPSNEPPAELKKLGNLVMLATMSVWQDEMDRGTVTDINRDVAATLKLCGPAILMTENGTVVPEICQTLLAIITKHHICQQDDGEEMDEDMLEESSEYDWLVIETAMETITCLSVALGPQFSELWKMFEKPLMKYASSQESTERSAAVGTIAECVGNMGAGCTPYTTGLLKLLLHRLSDEDPETKSNAVYGIGLLCEATTNDEEILKSLSTIFSKLEPLLDAQDQARLLDNTAGCVSRFITKHTDRLPIAEVLPRLVNLLPLREDYEENKPVFGMIVKLYQKNDATVQQMTPRLMPVFEKVLGEPQDQLEDETRSQLVELVQYLRK
ncbi:ARM repeat-containing protein [Dothidotthia symphoricarpi CBS 119687]|uniref:ARM repeat-containing protein n=1 Tax=Dothidotthia symphoricarpi CBS 119687 TaxID=1392245 RepID=A0A6A5ZYW6_9PLEO|nr:ARM repeat-containing protein [Dothidotthia symphoricarpi CBS 119687]KAF2124073.1 ARM repeat-containing protein [Dothidotthia symphoricarpi CBS 119687]